MYEIFIPINCTLTYIPTQNLLKHIIHLNKLYKFTSYLTANISTSQDKPVNTVYRNNRYLFSHKTDNYTVSAKCRGLDTRYLRCTSK